MASALVHGSTGVEAFSEAAVAHPEVQRLAQKVRLHEDAAMTQRLPGLRQARVVLRLVSGQQHAGQVHTNRGDAEEPLGDEELAAKFLQLAQGTWSPEAAAHLRWRLLALECIADVSTLFERLDDPLEHDV